MNIEEKLLKKYKVPKKKCPHGYRKYGRNCQDVTENVLCLTYCGKYKPITHNHVLMLIVWVSCRCSESYFTVDVNDEKPFHCATRYDIEKHNWQVWGHGNSMSNALFDLLINLHKSLEEWEREEVKEILMGKY